MTTVAVSTKFGAMACDRQFTYMGSTKMRGATKVMEIPEASALKVFDVKKAFLGFSGNADVWTNVVTWFYTLDDKPPRCKNIEFLLLHEGGIYHGTNLTNWFLITEPHFAIGSGYSHALTAMDMGATPLEAVKAAAKRDAMTGMGYKNYEL
jgi:hypothetical protein